MDARPELSFVIPVRSDAARLRVCLQSLRALVRPEHAIEIVVADNGSTDRSADVARELGARVVSLPNRVVAAVRNAGARESVAPLIAFVDADHELDAGWVDAALAVMRDDAVAAAGADYHPPANGTWVQAMYDRLRRHPMTREETDWLPGGNLVMRRGTFESVGGFDTSLESCEDVDLCQRVRASGAKLLADPALRSVHHGDPRTLRAVFFSELWRGRDNLRVTLRDRLSARTVASLGFTVLYLAGLVAIAAGVLALPIGGRPVTPAIGAGVVLALTFLRTRRLMSAGGSFWRALRFAAVFDTARALALVVRVGHQTRRKDQ